MRAFVISAHRWIGVGAAALWILQATTGIFCVFHWEIDDAITPGAHRPTDFRAIERSVKDLAPYSIWTTAGAYDRYDVNVEGRTIRIDGAGNVLRVRKDGESIVEKIVVLHQSLLSGTRGRWIVGFSGLLLASNLLLGLIAAWPRRGQWKRALTPRTAGARIAKLYSWHRALGLWLAIPSLCLVTAGVLLAFDEITERVFRPPPLNAPAQTSKEPRTIGMAAAVEKAHAQYPGAAVSGIGFPKPDDAVWRMTLKQRGELSRAYGKTYLFVSAIDGRIVANFDALKAPPSRSFLNLLFPIHAGEIGGRATRIAVLVMGLWLLTMITLGLALWWNRRAQKFPRRRFAPSSLDAAVEDN